MVHVPSFFRELETLQGSGILTQGRILLSDRCHLVFDLHQICDALEEAELGTKLIGTTRKGIGPAYASKASRSGVRVHHLFEWEEFQSRFNSLVATCQRRFGEFEYDADTELARYKVSSNKTDLIKGIC